MVARLVPLRNAAQMSKRLSMDAACAGAASVNAGQPTRGREDQWQDQGHCVALAA